VEAAFQVRRVSVEIFHRRDEVRAFAAELKLQRFDDRA